MKTMSTFDIFFTRNVPHILEKIFFALDFESYKKCTEVSNTWNELLSTESFKKRAKSVFKQKISEDERTLLRKSKYGSYRADPETVRKLILSGLVDVNVADERGWTPLHHAASARNTEVVRILLDGGADPNKKSKCGDTPLNEAWWDCLGVVKLLLEAGADPNWNGSDGMAPLHEAWNTDAVQILLDGGADPNYRDSDGSTPLHTAVTSCRKDLVQILLDGGALPDQVDDEGDTPYYLAARHG